VQCPGQADAPAWLAADLAEKVFRRSMLHGVQFMPGGGDADRAEGMTQLRKSKLHATT